MGVTEDGHYHDGRDWTHSSRNLSCPGGPPPEALHETPSLSTGSLPCVSTAHTGTSRKVSLNTPGPPLSTTTRLVPPSTRPGHLRTDGVNPARDPYRATDLHLLTPPRPGLDVGSSPDRYRPRGVASCREDTRDPNFFDVA